MSQNFEEILLPIKSELKKMESYIERRFKKDHFFIAEVGNYVVQSGGKRIRPVLMLLSSLCFGKYNEEVQKMSAILEYIHTASLLHDDVIDNANYRRNKKTAKNIWGNKASILVGDYLLAKAFEQLLEIRNFDLMQLISTTTIYLSEGEVLQLLHKWDDASLDKYLHIIRYKTACLMAAAMQTGAILTNQPKHITQKLYKCGEQIGMAFQIVDDVLDYSSKNTGKELGTDLKEKKITLPLCRLMELLDPKEKKKVLQILDTPKITVKQIQDVTDKMQYFKVFDYSIQQARKYIQRAKKILNTLPDNLYRKKLLELTDFILERDY